MRAESDEIDHPQRSLARRGFRCHRSRERHGSLQPAAPGLGVIADKDVVEDCHRAKEGHVLKCSRETAADHLVRPDREHRLTVDENGAVARPVHARDDVEQGRLAGAVGTDKCDHLPRLDFERNAIQGHHPTEADAQVANFEK